MDIDKSMLEKAAALPEEQLRDLIFNVVTAAGGSKMQARAAASSSEKLKKKLKTLTNEDIAAVVSSLDQAQIDQILALARGKGVDHG